MRANALLSPHRSQRRPAGAYDRSIVTEAPNLMWATDATQVATVRDGKVYVNGAQVVTADVGASNGVIHVIDAVLMPAAPSGR